MHLLGNYPDMNVTELHWWSVNIGSGNGLVPSGNKLLPEQMLIQICRHMASLGHNELTGNGFNLDAIRHQAVTWSNFGK